MPILVQMDKFLIKFCSLLKSAEVQHNYWTFFLDQPVTKVSELILKATNIFRHKNNFYFYLKQETIDNNIDSYTYSYIYNYVLLHLRGHLQYCMYVYVCIPRALINTKKHLHINLHILLHKLNT